MNFISKNMNGIKLYFLLISLILALGMNAQVYSVRSGKNDNLQHEKSSKGVVVKFKSEITDTLMNPPRKRVWKKGGKLMRWMMGDNVDLDFSPHITKDHVDEKGSRIVLCQSYGVQKKHEKIEDPFVRLSLSAIVLNSDTIYRISLGLSKVSENPSYSLKVDKGDILFLKNCDGEIIELRSDNDYDDIIGSKMPTVSGSLYSVSFYSYNIHPSYSIEEEDLRNILKGISKIRVAYNMEYYDLDIGDYELTDFLRLEYGLIKQAIQEKKTIYDGF